VLLECESAGNHAWYALLVHNLQHLAEQGFLFWRELRRNRRAYRQRFLVFFAHGRWMYQ
jgi:hypothetical protein